ncbi:arylsulfatase b [Plakobranchus ocellatus]|uniref:Arylsulfatase b n=1 Tax=Plakobranchus ocellatus TaxID=259542 RepID=A0AAV3Y4G7_9GAST|nr:arylsulfatase b [Plakobranchus ocellatus]
MSHATGERRAFRDSVEGKISSIGISKSSNDFEALRHARARWVEPDNPEEKSIKPESDAGWNDVGFHNPAIRTPNLDHLAKEGVILNQNYVQPLCSPSRAALMTGTYPYRMGLQHLVIVRGQRVCVPLNKTLLPEILKRKGYQTHMVGKWHLGFCDWKCTPTYRGFDSFYGYYSSLEDYYTKVYATGFDFRDNKTLLRSANGTYSTYLYSRRIRQIIDSHDTSNPLFLYLPFQSVHEPLEVPKNYSDLYPEITDEKRKTFSGMVTALDDAVGDLIVSLKRKGIYNNTLLVFTADNGGWVTYGGNNYPLRGGKFTVFEGGTRAVSFVHGPMFNKTGIKYEGLMHMVDWLPTLAEAAGAQYDGSDLDGVSQWQSLLSLALPSQRQEVLYNLDLRMDPVQGRAAIRYGDYKLVAGFPGLYPTWYPPPGAHGAQAAKDLVKAEVSIDCDKERNFTDILDTAEQAFRESIDVTAPIFYYLFNLKDDPEERNNLYDSHPDIVKQLQDRLDAHKKNYVPPNFPLPAPEADPAKFGGAWSPGWCPDI